MKREKKSKENQAQPARKEPAKKKPTSLNSPAAKATPSQTAPGKLSKGISKSAAAKSSPAPETSRPKAAPKAETGRAEKIPGKSPEVEPAPKQTGKPGGKTAPAIGKTAKKLQIPEILLEGDFSHPTTPPTPTAAAAARYDLGSLGSAGVAALTPGELPESYGTGKLFLTARDPHWLYATWDLTQEKQRELNRKSREGHLVLRVFKGDGGLLPEVHAHPESRSWFVYAAEAGSRYYAELGYYNKAGEWESVSTSKSTFTPPDAPSLDMSAEFATIPIKISFQALVEKVQEFVSENVPLMEAVLMANEEDLAAGRGTAAARGSAVKITKPETWSRERIEKLSRLINVDSTRRIWIGSLEITELIRRRLQEETASIAAAELAKRGLEVTGRAGGVSSISSPHGGEQRGRSRNFWFNVNAELVIYGATEPNATVVIGDRRINLREDGSFSFRFALPDGRYELPITATSADLEETREARLEFSRATEYRGDVAAHPQDPALRRPSAENVE